MLSKRQLYSLLMLHRRRDNIFSTLPVELIYYISRVGRNPKSDIEIALHHAAFAQQENINALIALLEKNPRLLCDAGDVITPAGIHVKRVTIYEFLLGSGNPVLAARIAPYFEKLFNDEKRYQSELYRPHIKNMPTQAYEDLTQLFDIIKKSSADDIAAELATGNKYDGNYQSPLRVALNEYREKKLRARIIVAPQMHCNYQNFIHACTKLYTNWQILYKASGNNYDKITLIARQIIGLIELCELPATERCLFARDQVEAAIAGEKTKNSYEFLHVNASFPNFDESLVNSHLGVGFSSFISMDGWRLAGAGVEATLWKNMAQRFTNLILDKHDRLMELMPSPSKAISYAMKKN